jgi:hypothetical protein
VVPEWNEPCIFGCKHPLALHNNSVGMLPTELPPVKFMNTNLLAAASFFALRKQTTRRNYTTIDQRARFRMYFKRYNIVILLLSVGQLSRTQSVDTSTGKPNRRLLELLFHQLFVYSSGTFGIASIICLVSMTNLESFAVIMHFTNRDNDSYYHSCSPIHC